MKQDSRGLFAIAELLVTLCCIACIGEMKIDDLKRGDCDWKEKYKLWRFAVSIKLMLSFDVYETSALHYERCYSCWQRYFRPLVIFQ